MWTFHIHSFLQYRDPHFMRQALLHPFWNRAVTNLFWWPSRLYWQRAVICQSSFPCLSGLYNHLSSDTSFSGCWALSDVATSSTEVVPLNLLQIIPVFFISSEPCTWYWSEMHQRVEKVAPGHTVYLSVPFPLRLFLKMHLLFLTTIQKDLRSPCIDLINFICDKLGLIIYFYPLLTIFQPIHI